METKANYVTVGIFTLLVVLAGFAFAYWAAGIGAQGETAQLRVRIPGSASGLARGSAVLFNGVKVGDVRRVYIDVSNPSVAIADTQIDRLTPITRSTAADIGLAGLTGQANIELKGGDPTEDNMLDEAEQAGTVAEITANPSAVTNLLQTAQQILTRADAVLVTLEDFVVEARGPLTETVRNVQAFSEALSSNAAGIDAFLANFSDLSEALGGVSTRLESALTTADELLKSVDREKVASIVDNVEGFTVELRTASNRLDGIMANVDGAVSSVTAFSENATTTVGRLDDILAQVDPSVIRRTVDDISEASASASTAARNVATLTDRFSERGEDIDRAIANASQMAERLNQASVRVDGILARVDNLLGSGEAEGVMAEATTTLRSFRQVADQLNARIGTVMDGLSRFSGQGLRDAEALIRDGRRSIVRIEQAITDLERNPQRIITGGEGAVRQYDGRMRR